MGTSELAWLVTRKMWEIAEGQAEENKAFKAELVLGFFPPSSATSSAYLLICKMNPYRIVHQGSDALTHKNHSDSAWLLASTTKELYDAREIVQ